MRLASIVLTGCTKPEPTGEMKIAFSYKAAEATYFDSSLPGQASTSFTVSNAMHDALLKNMPGKVMAPSWSMSPDGKVYEFKICKGGEVSKW